MFHLLICSYKSTALKAGTGRMCFVLTLTFGQYIKSFIYSMNVIHIDTHTHTHRCVHLYSFVYQRMLVRFGLVDEK